MKPHEVAKFLVNYPTEDPGEGYVYSHFDESEAFFEAEQRVQDGVTVGEFVEKMKELIEHDPAVAEAPITFRILDPNSEASKNHGWPEEYQRIDYYKLNYDWYKKPNAEARPSLIFIYDKELDPPPPKEVVYREPYKEPKSTEEEEELLLEFVAEKHFHPDVPAKFHPVVAEISGQNSLGKTGYQEIVYHDGGIWRHYAGSETFDDGEKVESWFYVNGTPDGE